MQTCVLLHIADLYVLTRHWSFIRILQKRDIELEIACHFFLEMLLPVGIKGLQFLLPFQCSDRSSSMVIAKAALVALKYTHWFFSKYLIPLLPWACSFCFLKHVKEANIVDGLPYSPFIFTAKYTSGKCLYIALHSACVEGSQAIFLILPLFMFLWKTKIF